MADLFADRLLEAIAVKGAPICVGIDPVYEMLPDDVAGPGNRRNANDAEACVDAIFAFTTEILRLVAPLVPAVKFQSAYFEKYLWEGVEAYYSLVQEAQELGLLVIGDVKRGDIGSTSSAYRSEEHTSELQSLAYLVCRLLLEKKKQKMSYLTVNEVKPSELSLRRGAERFAGDSLCTSCSFLKDSRMMLLLRKIKWLLAT